MKFFLEKQGEYKQQQIACIQEAVAALEELESRPLMMLGKIQSGKTKTFIGVIALAFDRGYDITIILTKSSNALAQQTVARVQSEFQTGIREDYLEVYDIMNLPKELSSYEMDKKIVLVVKKQKDNLNRLLSFISNHAQKKYLLIDDEADYTSIGFEKNKLTDAFDLRKISGQINQLRKNIDCRFIQVTATPYALYLQPEDIKINHQSIEPIKPAKTILVPTGEGYIGGQYYFSENDNRTHLFQMIPEDELLVMKQSDRRRFKIEHVLESTKIGSLRTAILTFIVGGCIRLIQNGGNLPPRGQKNKFSFIVHTEIAKAAHNNQYEIVEAQLMALKQQEFYQTKELIRPIYEDLILAFKQSGEDIPSFTEVLSYFRQGIKGWVKTVVVNSENDMNSLLDETGQLKLSVPFTIFLGGQVLDRGITIANLIGFYYGRRPQKMQQDTVLQHARMFGYRHPLDLLVTRFYTTLDIYERMRKINEFDCQMWEDFEQGKMDQGLVFIAKDSSGAIIPCSPNKVLISQPNLIKAYKRIVPYGFQTKTKTSMRQALKQMDKTVMNYNSGEFVGQFKVPKQEAVKMIEYFYNMIEEDEPHSVGRKDFLGIIEYLSSDYVNVLSRDNRDMPRLRANGESINAPAEGELLAAARTLATTEPTLILLRQKGRKVQGWKDGEFWWPVLVVPRKVQAALFTTLES